MAGKLLMANSEKPEGPASRLLSTTKRRRIEGLAPWRQKLPRITSFSDPSGVGPLASLGRKRFAGAASARSGRRLTSRQSWRPRHARPKFRWAAAIEPSDWEIYRAAMTALRTARVPFLLGGGFALATFIGRWRDTKDIDFYIMPEARQAAIAALTRAGFADYFDCRSYDRKWIYRSVRSNVIVDLIWSMANQRSRVDDLWFQRAGSVSIRGEKLALIPKEEFIWCKLYILQRDHCDWTDIFNVFYATGRDLDWGHILRRLGEDRPLLQAALTVYGWLCPRRARELPASLWKQLGLIRPRPPGKNRRNRIRLLDSRAWFAALLPQGHK